MRRLTLVIVTMGHKVKILRFYIVHLFDVICSSIVLSIALILKSMSIVINVI